MAASLAWQYRMTSSSAESTADGVDTFVESVGTLMRIITRFPRLPL